MGQGLGCHGDPILSPPHLEQDFNPIYRSKRGQLNERTRQWLADTADEFRLPEV